jgi:methyltransferase
VTTIAIAILVLVTAQRLCELVLARRNTKRLIAQGARETGAAHYPLIMAVHAAWLLSLFALTPSVIQINWWLFGAFGALQCGRIWVLTTLGPYWTTRIITLPGAPLVRRGPYRWFRHPNYMIVCGEIALLPLAFGHTKTAIVFSIFNVAILMWRIHIENNMLAEREVI